MNWDDCTLGDVVTLKRGHDLPNAKRVPGDVPVVSSSGFTGSHNEAKAEPPGVVTGRYGTLGEVFYVTEPYWPLNTALYAIDFHGNDPRFVAYFLRNELRDYRSDKAAVPGVDRNVLHRLPVRCPDLQAQQQIVRILSAYDDLIENNRRRIALLEEAARLLYREWFVHFRFPGHEHVKIVNGIPEGWEAISLNEFCDTQYGYTESASNEPIGPKFLRGTDINKASYIDWSSVPYCPIEEKDHKKYKLHEGDILIIRMADPGKSALIEESIDAVFASYLVRLRQGDQDKLFDPLYLFYCLIDPRYQQFIANASGGSTRKSASAPLLTKYAVLKPPNTNRH